MRSSVTAFAMLLFCIPAFSDDAAARAQLIGTWQQLDDAGKVTSVWILESKGASLHISHSQGGEKLSECDCKPTGADCQGMASGQKATVTMYFNGPTLVQFETVGAEVTRRQFKVADQPGMMDLEVTPITGSGKAETVHLKRL